MRHIIVATDFSENAYNALVYASKAFEKDPSVILILHSFDFQASRLTSRIDIGRSEEVFDELYDKADRRCEEVKDRLINEGHGYGHTFDIVSTAMSLPRALNWLSSREDTDLVVMGTKGLTGAKEVILGSTAIQVIRKIWTTPVLIVPPETDFGGIKTIAFPSSFEHGYKPGNLEAISYLAELFGAEIKILHVQEDEKISDEQRENLDQLMKLFGNIPSNVEWLETGDGVTSAINDYIDEQQADILAMIFYKHNFIVQLFRESVVKKIGRDPIIPYLVIPAN